MTPVEMFLFGDQQSFSYAVIIILLFMLEDIMAQKPKIFTKRNVITIEVMAFLTTAAYVSIWDESFGFLPGSIIGYEAAKTILRNKDDNVLVGGYIIIMVLIAIILLLP